MIKAFGDVEHLSSVHDSIADGLDLQFDDNYMIQIVHKNGNKGVLIVDVVSPIAVRRLELYGENKYLRWDGTPESMFVMDDHGKLVSVDLYTDIDCTEGYADFIIENGYSKEIECFYDWVDNGIKPNYGFEDDLAVLSLIDRSEE